MNTLSLVYMRFLPVFILILVTTVLPAQTRKGERLVNEGRYEEAVKPLKRAFDDGKDRKAGELLITSYYMLQEYQEALDIAELMNMQGAVDETEMILYADVLIANNDFSSAYLNLTRMLSAGGAKVQGYKWLNKTGNLLQWDSLSTGSTISDIQGLNTIYNEYAPYISEDGLIYVADHLTVQVLHPAAYTNQSLHLLFKSPVNANGKFGRSKMLLKGREYYYHDGPIEEQPRQERYALTLREIEGLLYDLKMNIFFSKLTGAEEDLEPFKYNGTHNTGHPTFTEDGNRMYFTSDRPGGYGQLDLWYSDFIGGEWTVPVNAGPAINSPANELYPRIRNHRLFFSSDRRDIGYGGLDLYYISLLSKYDQPYNLRAPINSAYDDFAVDFIDEKSGYFSSNRRGGFGGDDIYKMNFQPESYKLDTMVLALEDKSGTRKTIRLYDRVGNEMVGIDNADQTMTISNLFTRELYTVKTDSLFDNNLTLVAYNNQGRKIQEFNSDSSTFKVEFIEQDQYSMKREKNVDDSELFDLFGSVVSNEEENFDQVKVFLIGNDDRPIGETKTDSTGKFLIRGLTWDEAYTISTEGTKGDVEIDVLGQSGAPITTLTSLPGKNSFAYTRRMPEADWMMTTATTFPAVFGIVPTNDLTVSNNAELRTLGDSLIRPCNADEDGFIEMGSLVTGHAYELVFDKELFKPTDRLVILDGNGDTTQTVRPDNRDSFVFEFMTPGKLREKESQPLTAALNGRDDDKVEEVNSPLEGKENLSVVSSQLESGDKVKLYNSKKELITESYAKAAGSFSFNRVSEDSIYYLEISVSQPFNVISTYHGYELAATSEPGGMWVLDFTNDEETEKVITLPNIYYRFDRYTLSPKSTTSLENLYGFLKQNPSQKITVLSHTDSRGTKAYNEKLSNLRAREVVRYLIRKGIDEERLNYEGRGESSPVNECVDGVPCSNEKHAQNRRTEFVLNKN